MRHELSIEGRRFALRPVELDDAEFIVSLRSDPSLNRFIHATSNAVADQISWIERYLDRAGDWYFVVFDRRTGENAGTIAIYDYNPDINTAEWGRWIVRPPSLAAIESALLMYRVAFEQLDLASVFCRTVADNRSVVSFHDSSGAKRNRLLSNHVQLHGRTYDSVEHVVDRACWASMRERLQLIANRLGS